MQAERCNIREYIGASVIWLTDGTMQPHSIVRRDGRRYSIDQVLEIRPVCTEQGGEPIDRYAVMIDGRRQNIFFKYNMDKNDLSFGRWFIEREE